MGMRQVFAVLVAVFAVACLSSSPAPPQVAESTVGDVSDGRVVGVAELLIALEGVASGTSIGTEENRAIRRDEAALLGVLGYYGTCFDVFVAAMEQRADFPNDMLMDGIESPAGSSMPPGTSSMDWIESPAGSSMPPGTSFMDGIESPAGSSMPPSTSFMVGIESPAGSSTPPGTNFMDEIESSGGSSMPPGTSFMDGIESPIQATTCKEILDKPDFLHFSPVRSMLPWRCRCAPVQCAGPMTEVEMESTWTRHIRDTAVLKR